jgi:hypothetical protein
MRMSKLKKCLITALAAVTLVGMMPVTAEAQPIHRPPPPGMGPGGPGPSHHGAPPRRGGGGAGAGAALGILGGVIIGSAISAQQAEAQRRAAYEDAIADCAARFKSYDPYSQTYRGYDGKLHRCP